MVLWQVVRQVLRFDNSRQVASGTFSVNTITKNTGYHHRTIWKRLGVLQARKVLKYRAGKGTVELGEVWLNLRLDEWLPPAETTKKPRGRRAAKMIQADTSEADSLWAAIETGDITPADEDRVPADDLALIE